MKETKYHRCIVMTNRPVDGSYKYKDIFHFSPPKQSISPPFKYVDYPAVLEVKFTARNDDATTDNGHRVPAWAVCQNEGRNRAYEVMTLLGAISKFRIFSYNGKQSWYINLEETPSQPNHIRTHWGQQFIHIGEFNCESSTMSPELDNKIALIDDNVYFNKNYAYSDAFELPSSTNRILDSYFSLDERAKTAFISSCSLLCKSQAIYYEHPSLAVVALISSIETICAHISTKETRSKCCTCGQMVFKISKSFRDFIEKHGTTHDQHLKLSKKLYNLRSKILHEGRLLLGEIEFPLLDRWTVINQEDEFLMLLKITRISLVNWLLEQAHLQGERA